MLGDLKQQLEGLGRLNLLDATVAKTMKYLGTSETNQSDETLARRAEALTVVAELRYAQGNVEEAIVAGKDAVATARTVVRRAPSDRADEHLARALYAVGEPSLEAGNFAETTAGTEEALAIAVRLLAADPASTQRSTLAAALYDQRAYIYGWGPEPVAAAAQANWRHCIETLKPALTRDDAWPPQLRYLIRCEAALGVSLYLAKAPNAELVGHFDAMLADADAAMKRFPEDRSLLGVILYGLSNATASYEKVQLPEKAVRASAQALVIGRQLVAFEPNNVEFKRQLMQALRRQAQLDLVSRQWVSARAPLDEALQMAPSVLEGTANGHESRRMVMYLRTLRAYQAAMGPRDRAAALEDARAGFALFHPADTDANLLQAAADLALVQWALARGLDAAQAAQAEDQSRQLVALIEAKKDPALTEWRPAAVLYLSGHIEEGDRQAYDPYWLVEWLRAEGCAKRACPVKPAR
jgi:tetratricopeptide (TPR) repeat protein